MRTRKFLTLMLALTCSVASTGECKIIRFFVSKMGTVCLLFICMLYSTKISAESDSEIIVDSVIEKCHFIDHDEEPYYLYNTIESKEAKNLLNETYECINYDIFFAKALRVDHLANFREAIMPLLSKIEGVNDSLAGKRLMVSFYIKADGSVVCDNVSLSHGEKLFKYLSSEKVKRIINIINVYRFRPSDSKGNKYTMGMVMLFFPNPSNCQK